MAIEDSFMNEEYLKNEDAGRKAQYFPFHFNVHVNRSPALVKQTPALYMWAASSQHAKTASLKMNVMLFVREILVIQAADHHKGQYCIGDFEWHLKQGRMLQV